MPFRRCQAQIPVLHSPLVLSLVEGKESCQYSRRGDGTPLPGREEFFTSNLISTDVALMRAQTTERHVGLKS